VARRHNEQGYVPYWSGDIPQAVDGELGSLRALSNRTSPSCERRACVSLGYFDLIASESYLTADARLWATSEEQSDERNKVIGIKLAVRAYDATLAAKICAWV
jgi:hypothetical protein